MLLALTTLLSSFRIYEHSGFDYSVCDCRCVAVRTHTHTLPLTGEEEPTLTVDSDRAVQILQSEAVGPQTK